MCPGSTSDSTGSHNATREEVAAANEETRPPRVLFLTDSLDEKSRDADALLRLAASLNASGIETAIVSFLPCKKARREQILALGVPVRYLQFFNSRLRFYAPGLTGTVLLFRPDVVVPVSSAAHLHVGPLARAFRGLRVVSLGKTSGLLRRLARRHCAAVFETAFPPKNSTDAEYEAFLKDAAKTFLRD